MSFRRSQTIARFDLYRSTNRYSFKLIIRTASSIA